MRTGKREWLTAIPFILAVVLVIGLGAWHKAAERQAEADAAAQAKAHTAAYLLDAHGEQGLHNDAYGRVESSLYFAAWAVHRAAVTDAEQANAEAAGKVPGFELGEDGRIGTPAEMRHRAAALSERTAALREQVAAYDAEQARLAAEAEAARAAQEAQEAAERAQYAETYSDPEYAESYSEGPSGGVDYTLRVAGSGGQGLVDACVGAVHFDTYPNAGLVEHWSCGGSSFPQWAGAIVNVVGEGVYRTTGVIGYLNGWTATTDDLPGQYFYQTCQGGDPSQTVFIGLERIG